MNKQILWTNRGHQASRYTGSKKHLYIIKLFVFNQKIKDKGLELIIDIPSDLPKALISDKIRLRQILNQHTQIQVIIVIEICEQYLIGLGTIGIKDGLP